MKKLFSIAFACLLLLALCACGAPSAKSLYANGMDIVALLDEMARSDDYIALLTGSSEVQEAVAGLREGDYTAPTAVYKVTVPDNAFAALLGEDSNAVLDGFSDALRASIDKKTLASVPNMINGRAGTAKLTAAAILGTSKTFTGTDAEDCLYFYCFASGAPIAVVFTTGEDGTVSASGCFLMCDDFPTDSAASVADWMNSTLYLTGCVVGDVAIG